MSHLLAFILLLSSLTLTAEESVRIIHINVGQGDATLILGPTVNGKRISVLMDAGDIPMHGDKDGGNIIMNVLAKNGVSMLDYFIASHYDADHIGGIITGRTNIHGKSFVLGHDGEPGNVGDDDHDGIDGWLDANKRTKVDHDEIGRGDDIVIGTFIDRGDVNAPSSLTYKKYVALVHACIKSSMQSKRISINEKSDLTQADIDLGGGANITFVSGNGFIRDGNKVPNVDTENERSICILLSYNAFHYLNGGDTIGRGSGAEDAQVEDSIGHYIQANDINIDILHVNHHGADNGSSAGFLEMVSPEIAIISLGNGNDHHHPRMGALERLAEAGVYRIYQTEWGTTKEMIPEAVRRRQAIFQGDIIVNTNGRSYEISTSRIFDTDD